MEGRFSFLRGMKFDYAYDRDDPYYFFIAMLTEYLRPKVALDLGTCEGVSSYCMAVFSPGTSVVTIDKDLSYRRPECKLPNILAVEQDTEQPIMPEIIEVVRGAGLVFVDTYHEGPMAQAEFDRWRPFLAPGALVLFDGCTWPPRPSMGAWWADFRPEGCVKMDLHELHAREEAGFGAVLIK
jgi:Methyltransferase domain